jgi:hypothetical protein
LECGLKTWRQDLMRLEWIGVSVELWLEVARVQEQAMNAAKAIDTSDHYEIAFKYYEESTIDCI